MHKGSREAVVIGAGMIAAVHRRAVVAAGAQVRGVVASTPERSSEVAKRWGTSQIYETFDEVLTDEQVDVVHICTPNGLHVEHTIAALRAGKHVICEKPLATTAREAEQVSALAESLGLVLAVPFVYRYHPIVREIRARRVAGEFGAWQLLHGSYLQDWMLPPDVVNWRVDPAKGGRSRAFADIGSHWCDLVEWVAGVQFVELSARLATTIQKRPVGSSATFSGTTRDHVSRESDDGVAPTAQVRTEDVAIVMLRTEEGTLATLTVSQVSAGRKNRLWFELDGSEGSAVFDQESSETAWLGSLSGNHIIVRDPSHGSDEQRRLSVLPAGHAQGYEDCFRAFTADAYAAMAGETIDGLPTGADGVRSAQLVDAVLDSASKGAWTPTTGTTRNTLAGWAEG